MPCTTVEAAACVCRSLIGFLCCTQGFERLPPADVLFAARPQHELRLWSCYANEDTQQSASSARMDNSWKLCCSIHRSRAIVNAVSARFHHHRASGAALTLSAADSTCEAIALNLDDLIPQRSFPDLPAAQGQQRTAAGVQGGRLPPRDQEFHDPGRRLSKGASLSSLQLHNSVNSEWSARPAQEEPGGRTAGLSAQCSATSMFPDACANLRFPGRKCRADLWTACARRVQLVFGRQR